MHNQRLGCDPTDIPRPEGSRIIGRPARADGHGGGRVATERNVNDTCVILDVPAQDHHLMDVSCGSSVNNVYARRSPYVCARALSLRSGEEVLNAGYDDSLILFVPFCSLLMT